ncbi:S-adenosylmethionine-dependent methyltransferase [Aspergillus stella-maris]|uniref:S-adenosylmethionine-dependent methyltransferase n=1 Tax=Aspergillus stella-maris TaxID=1810926 RepID=UPI003CCC9D85
MEDAVKFLSNIGEEVEDAEEESFLLFSQDIPSSNLGFVDSKASTIDLSIHDNEYTIHQSPTLLSSSRAGGTTGAVLWKINPLFASWLSDISSNPLWREGYLTSSSTIVELGCGISALTALCLAPLLEPRSGTGHYLATDQEYVHRLFRTNLQANPPKTSGKKVGGGGKGSSKGKKSQQSKGNDDGGDGHGHLNITFTSLDWETDIPDTLKSQIQSSPSTSTSTNNIDEEEEADKGFDLLLSCDCIYNEALISPFVRTCADVARLRSQSSSPSSSSSSTRNPTVAIIAQQQRSPDVFEAWLRETMRYFRVFRLADDVLRVEGGLGLGGGSGYLVHALVLR